MICENKFDGQGFLQEGLSEGGGDPRGVGFWGVLPKLRKRRLKWCCLE